MYLILLLTVAARFFRSIPPFRSLPVTPSPAHDAAVLPSFPREAGERCGSFRALLNIKNFQNVR
jgi:hypothetical protein